MGLFSLFICFYSCYFVFINNIYLFFSPLLLANVVSCWYFRIDDFRVARLPAGGWLSCSLTSAVLLYGEGLWSHPDFVGIGSFGFCSSDIFSWGLPVESLFVQDATVAMWYDPMPRSSAGVILEEL